jgi:hypothetical protein
MDNIQIIVPAGMFGANEFDSALDKFLREVAVKHVAPDSDDWFPMGTPERNAEKYGLIFENDLFLMHPDYADVECDCGHSEKVDAWHDANLHAAECYDSIRHARFEEWEQGNPKADWDTKQQAEKKICRELCARFGIPWNDGKASYCHCTCGQRERCDKWYSENDHEFRCPVALPNFWYKPLDFRVTWYKYIGRDTHTNKELTQAEFGQMWRDCLGEDDWPDTIE